MRRSEFLRAGGAALAAAGGLGALAAAVLDAPPRGVTPDQRRRGLVRPPGALPEAEFLSACIRCQRCAEACEPSAIRLLGPGHGRLTDTPMLVLEERACTLCRRCGEACPTGALRPLPDLHASGFASAAGMGVAVVDKRRCVSHNGTGVCGACHTACPLRGKALKQGAHNAPTVFPAECSGCGLCEEACIVRDEQGGRAIQVLSPRRWS